MGAKFPTEKAVHSRGHDKGHMFRREQGSENGAQKTLLGDVYSSAREIMYQFTGKCQMEASHSSAWKHPLTQLIERILGARDIIR